MATSTSLFPLHLAKFWRLQGLDVSIVARDALEDHLLDDGTKIISVRQRYGRVFTKISKNYRLLAPLENLIFSLYKSSYIKKTGQAKIHAGEAAFLGHLFEAVPTANVARALSPRFVFAHDVAHYGLALALCKGIPKILFPWGGEIFMGAETSPFLCNIIKYSLHAADLVVPSSVTAAAHICERFAVSPEKVKAISWGVDTAKFVRADEAERRDICLGLGIAPTKFIVTNPRRFRPTWGCFVALEAFMRLAAEDDKFHFVMLGGLGTEEHVRKGRDMIAAAGMADRFTFVDGDVSLDRFAQIMSVSDVFVSLLGLGDMRSVSVLQAASAGAVPVISRNPEYLEMASHGFSGVFVDQSSSLDVYAGVKALSDDKEMLVRFREINKSYLSLHENSDKQMKLLLDMIMEVEDKITGRA